MRGAVHKGTKVDLRNAMRTASKPNYTGARSNQKNWRRDCIKASIHWRKIKPKKLEEGEHQSQSTLVQDQTEGTGEGTTSKPVHTGARSNRRNWRRDYIKASLSWCKIKPKELEKGLRQSQSILVQDQTEGTGEGTTSKPVYTGARSNRRNWRRDFIKASLSWCKIKPKELEKGLHQSQYTLAQDQTEGTGEGTTSKPVYTGARSNRRNWRRDYIKASIHWRKIKPKELEKGQHQSQYTLAQDQTEGTGEGTASKPVYTGARSNRRNWRRDYIKASIHWRKIKPKELEKGLHQSQYTLAQDQTEGTGEGTTSKPVHTGARSNRRNWRRDCTKASLPRCKIKPKEPEKRAGDRSYWRAIAMQPSANFEEAWRQSSRWPIVSIPLPGFTKFKRTLFVDSRYIRVFGPYRS